MLRWRMRQVCGAYPLDKVIRKRLPEKGVIQPLCLIRGESRSFVGSYIHSVSRRDIH